jgi:adenosine deaminase
MTHVTLSQEYAKLHQTFGWNAQDFYQCNRNALNAAFVPEDERNRLLARLVEGYEHVL